MVAPWAKGSQMSPVRDLAPPVVPPIKKTQLLQILSVDKLDQEKMFSVTLAINLCIDDVCEEVIVIDKLKVPIPLCNTDISSIQLPGDGSIAGFATELGSKIGNSAVDLVIEKLGLGDYVSKQDCREGALVGKGNSCPSISLPIPADLLSCHPTLYCTGIACCAAVDIKVTQLFLQTWLAVDPCDFELSVGLGSWMYNKTLLDLDWGIERELVIVDALKIKYKIDKLDAQKSFQIDLSVIVCIDGTCEMIPVVSQLLVPIPFCNTNGTLSLPGGSINGYLTHLAGDVTDTAIDLVLNTLGIKEFVSDQACTVPTSASGQGCTQISVPPLLPQGVSCSVDNSCHGFQCCADIDLKITRRSLDVYLQVDPCNFVLSVGFGEWSLNVSLFTYTWGTIETQSLGNAIDIRYECEKQL
ncbi:uncharacterized protein [Amphiura filiformis]|uniref:uncharacterized protein n=1 Tax=Amphiura filiformis TaxID=82378 RepID=UPI003B20C556